MSKFEIKYPHGATPLDPDEKNGLIPDYITTQGELNILERENILEAINWAHGKKHPHLLSVSFIYKLHKRMLNRIWKWAGKARQSDKNIGVQWAQVPTQLASLLNDTQFWIQHNTYPWDEIGARFHHRLVSIHAFPNGNGRHARLMTDLLLEVNGQEIFSWGLKSIEASLETEGPDRDEYLAALQEADSKKYARLIRFCRS